MTDGVTMARSGLLDALEALESHLGALVLVGAQAIYLHTGSLDVALAEFTTDGDVAIDPDLLSSEPLVEDAMSAAGFTPDVDPGRVRLLAASQRPTALKALTGALEGELAWRTLPSWALLATQDAAIPLPEQESMAQRAGSEVVRVDSSHAVPISHPEAVAEIVDRAARAVS